MNTGGKAVFFKKIEELRKVVRDIEIDEIIVGTGRFRVQFEGESMRALADSIKSHGVIEPLIVRFENGLYYLVAGERRLRAAEMAGLSVVPCISVAATQIEAAVIAIIENLHREDLNMFEEASAIRSLIELGSMTQETLARRLSVSQSYIANKLRLLRLSEDEKEAIVRCGLTERHARALLRISAEGERREILSIMIERQMNVAAAEEYIESILCAESRANEIRSKPDRSEQRHKLIIKDIRLFYNSIDHAVDVIKKCGIPVESTRKETDSGTLISILLPKEWRAAG
ncbi:MAG: ParB/RepB/Spo0J family partition protein [Ruminococcaceae bacterium]|nr:ParB/RepB/Spo0J family partition protein [Oscillospiraceae bacterium]